MRLKLPLAVLAVAVSWSTSPLQAQAGGCLFETGTSCNAIHRASATVPTVAELVLSTTSTSFTVNRAAYLAGQATAPGPDISVSANTVVTLAVRSDANWSGPWAKPASDLLLSINGGTPVALSATDQALSSGGPGVNPAVPTQLVSRWSFASDPPGNYFITLTFTLAAP